MIGGTNRHNPGPPIGELPATLIASFDHSSHSSLAQFPFLIMFLPIDFVDEEKPKLTLTTDHNPNLRPNTNRYHLVTFK